MPSPVTDRAHKESRNHKKGARRRQAISNRDSGLLSGLFSFETRFSQRPGDSQTTWSRTETNRLSFGYCSVHLSQLAARKTAIAPYRPFRPYRPFIVFGRP